MSFVVDKIPKMVQGSQVIQSNTNLGAAVKETGSCN